MAYQSKTTLVRISVGVWTEATERSLSTRFDAAYAVAVQIGSLCQMDIMSFIPQSLGESEECHLTVVYINNGRTFDDIRRLMKPEIDRREQKYWILQDLYEWEGLLECVVSVRGNDEKWE